MPLMQRDVSNQRKVAKEIICECQGVLKTKQVFSLPNYFHTTVKSILSMVGNDLFKYNPLESFYVRLEN